MVTLLCAIYSLRILGLYMVLPVLSPYASSLSGATSLLIGLAIGAYGLTQAFLQLPFGYLSDRLGRKAAISTGLLLFAAGSFICAMADSVVLLVVGRLLQGTGAIASSIVALAADLTTSAVRTQAMARFGIWIGSSFAVGMTVGPFVAGHFGVPPLFWATGIMTLASAALLLTVIPSPEKTTQQERVRKSDLLRVLRHPPLLVLDLGSFSLHMILTAIFVILPVQLRETFGSGRLWIVIGPVVLVGLACMALVARYSDRNDRHGLVLTAGAWVLIAACAVFATVGSSTAGGITGLAVMVLALACLEPVLPALTTRVADASVRGGAMGVFHMAQFLGAFTGGAVGGAFLRSDARPMWIGMGILVLSWMFLIRRVSFVLKRDQ